MASRDDRRAAAVLVLLALVGTAVRLVRMPGAPPGGIGYRPADASRPDRAAVEERAERTGPLQPGETIDVDRADAADLVRLPRIGPALAARIVRDRAERGGFGSLEGLGRVRGIGPSVLDEVRPYVTFSAAPAPQIPQASREKVSLNTATPRELEQLPGIGPARARAIVEHRIRVGPFRSIDDLRQVPGIGPATVERLKAHLEVR